MVNKIIYAIPGLGVDERIFFDLKLDCKVHYINWLAPKPKESLRSYAGRMATNIPNDKPCILLGMSFGGVLVQEIATIRPVSKLVLISSIKSKEEKPWQMKLMRHLPLYYLSQGSWRIKAAAFMAPWYGIHDQEDITLLMDMFSKFDDKYRMWAIGQICHWEGCRHKVPFLHIHGDRDKIIPIQNIQNPVIISGGNHFMVKQRADEISALVNEWLET